MMIGSKVDYDISNLYIPKDGKGDNDYKKSFNITLTIIVKDKDGNVIKRYKQKSHSPTSNFIGLMLPVSYYNEVQKSWTMTNTSNSTFSYGYPNLWTMYPNTGNNYPVYIEHIMVGSGSQSNPYSAYNLALPIANGSGTGQLLYSAPNLPTGVAINGSQAYFIISQSYNNQSGGTITISEVGIILYLQLAGNAVALTSSDSILVWYDTLSSPISVGSGQSAVIYYTFSVNA